MTDHEKNKLDAVYEYCKQEQEFWEEQRSTVWGGILAGLIMLPLIVIGCVLLQTYAPELWQQLQSLWKWA